jgi:hypothetical protein
MTKQDQPRPLKVCHTCRHWVYQYKGLCQRLGQGVGKFWYCEEWTEAPGDKPQPGDSGKASATH